MDLCSIGGRRELTDIMRGEHMNTNAAIFQCQTQASTGERNQLCIKERRTFIRSKRVNRVKEHTISSKGCFLGLKKGEFLE